MNVFLSVILAPSPLPYSLLLHPPLTHCSVPRELYSVLLRALQAVTRDLDSPGPLLAPQLQRVLALLALLTQVTHTAGCHQELHAAMLRSGGCVGSHGVVGVCVVRL